MTTDITSSKWQGERATPINPATIRFIAEPGRTCKKCLFASQSGIVCTQAVDIAQAAGMPPCTGAKDYVYVLDVSEQKWLVEVAQ